MPKAIDWAALEAAYITSDKSYRDLALEVNTTQQNVARVGKRESWPAKRAEYRKKNMKKAIERHSRKDVNKLERLMEAADWINAVLADVKKDPQQFNRHLVTQGMDGMTETVEKIFAKIDTRAIRDLSGAIKDMTTATRNLYGLPTQAEAEAQRVAAEKLKLDQAKAAKEEEDTGAEIIFVLGDEAKKYAD